MHKDPLAQDRTAYDIVLAALKVRGESVRPEALKPRDVQRIFAELHRTCGTAEAARIMAEVRRPSQRLALDLWYYYWPETPTRDASAQPPDPAAVLRATLRECCRVEDIELPLWTDLDRPDWSDDFEPIQHLPYAEKLLHSDLNEMDPGEPLGPPEPDF